MKKDWLFTDENNICGFRSAGVLIRDDKILVQREKNGNEYALPGGHVLIGETSIESLIREYKEETGAYIHLMILLKKCRNCWDTRTLFSLLRNAY